MNLPFEYKGSTHTLAKHPRVAADLKAGKITPDQAAARPWYFRPGWRRDKPFKLSANYDAAIRAAKDIIKGRIEKPEQFSIWLQEQDKRRGITLGELATLWETAGFAYSKTLTRDAAAAARLQATLKRAIVWWRDQPARTAAKHLEDFAAARFSKMKYGAGRRTVDVELACLSSLCQWAVLTQHLETNPFADRPKYVQDEEIEHCHRFMPDNDEQFHAILRHIWASSDPLDIIAGAWLAFGAFTGLRPHEPGFLLRVPRVNKFPDHLESEPNGLIFPMPDGSTRMKVRRGKGGQNPTITIHPVLSDFLRDYTAWLDRQPVPMEATPAPALLFPGRLDRLRDVLHRATAALKLREMHPHGFMRAYYVRVMKSSGKDAAIVAAELGQTTGGSLIRSVYGNPNDPFGGGLFDWLPAVVPPDTKANCAWSLLNPPGLPVSNVVRL